MGSPTVKRIFNQDISQGTKPKLRVCAYCRVSSKAQGVLCGSNDSMREYDYGNGGFGEA